MREDIIDNTTEPEVYQYKHSLTFIIILFILLFGTYFMRVQHWPGGKFFGAIITPIIISYSIFSFSLLKGKDKLNLVLFILSILWLGYLFWGMIYNNGYPYNEKGVMLNLGIIFIFHILFYIIYQIKKWRFKKKQDLQI